MYGHSKQNSKKAYYGVPAMKRKRPDALSRLIRYIDVKDIVSKSRERVLENTKFNSPPKLISRKYDIDHAVIAGRNCYTMSSAYEPDTHIVFLHGGAYRYPSTFFHWVLLDNLLTDIACEATFVDYPLAPKYTCEENVGTVMEIYKQLFGPENRQKIVLMGDSAGGGLALVMAQLIKAQNITPKPAKVVMLSPWLDISMETEIPEELKAADVMLDRGELKATGLEYAGGLDTKDPLCSPYYGDSKDVGEMALFIGTKDILYIDAERFRKKAKKEGCDLTFYEYEDMYHDWVLFPINDARDARFEIVMFIEK